MLVVADEPARHRHRRDHDVADRPAGGELGADLLEPGAELDEPLARRRRRGCRRARRRAALAAIRSPPWCSRAQRDELGDGRGADPAPGRADRAAERLRVDRVLEQRQVGERVADLGALVQPERAEHPVRDPGVRERALQRLGRVPGPREREDLGRRRAGGERVGDLPGDPVRLGVLVRERATRTWPPAPRIAISAFGAPLRCG